MQPTYFLIVVVCCCVVGALVWAIRYVRRVMEAARETIVERVRDDQLVRMDQANFFGQQSEGVMQVRGNGYLCLTDRELVFVRAAPLDEYDIPLDRIVTVSTPTSHLGKTMFRRLLRVDWEPSEGGELDSIAWLVPDVDAWVADLKQMVDWRSYESHTDQDDEPND